MQCATCVGGPKATYAGWLARLQRIWANRDTVSARPTTTPTVTLRQHPQRVLHLRQEDFSLLMDFVPLLQDTVDGIDAAEMHFQALRRIISPVDYDED